MNIGNGDGSCWNWVKRGAVAGLSLAWCYLPPSPALAQQPRIPLSQQAEIDRLPTFLPPVHLSPISYRADSLRAENRAENRVENRRVENTPAVQHIVSSRSRHQPVNVDAAVAPAAVGAAKSPARDPFAETWDQDYERVSQTPASPATRPTSANQFRQPQSERSVLNGEAASDAGGGQGLRQPARLPQMNDSGANSRGNPPIAGSLGGEPELNWDNEVPRGTEPRLRSISNAPAVPPRDLRNQDQDPDEGPKRYKSEKDCDEFRQQLLGQSITDIALDLSPPARSTADPLPAGEAREWLGRTGEVIARGSLRGLQRGYVIVDAGAGSLQRIPFARLSPADLQVVARLWQIPEECVVSTGFPAERMWMCQTVTWHASNLCHKPLYFEDVQLERYGHSDGPLMQPFRSAGHFFVSLFSVPYQTAIHPPNECIYALGYYRPGNCAPWLREPIPISLSGALRQAGVVTAGAYILP